MSADACEFVYFYFVTVPGRIEREVGRHEFRGHAGQHTEALTAEARRCRKASMQVGGVRLRVSALREPCLGILRSKVE